LIARATTPEANALFSPYSIQSALAMVYAGADGATRTETASALHYAEPEADLHRAFAGLRNSLVEIEKSTADIAEQWKKWRGPSDPITLTVANRLFGQTGYQFYAAFLDLLRANYDAPLEPMDFARDFSDARLKINDWVAHQTRQRIQDLIPPDGLDADTRMVLVNAIYLQAPWGEKFYERNTQPLPFHIHGRDSELVPTMHQEGFFGYASRQGYRAITIPFIGGEIQFLILLPDTREGLPALKARLNSTALAECAHLDNAELKLYFPKFKLVPPMVELAGVLQRFGMRTAFDQPPGSADFSRMARRMPDDYLFLSKVFHQTYLALDEKGVEAAAATAVAMMPLGAGDSKPRPEPIEVHVDRPFLFAIQHKSSGACLFLGQVSDPR
jgi:serpin B